MVNKRLSMNEDRQQRRNLPPTCRNYLTGVYGSMRSWFIALSDNEEINNLPLPAVADRGRKSARGCQTVYDRQTLRHLIARLLPGQVFVSCRPCADDEDDAPAGSFPAQSRYNSATRISVDVRMRSTLGRCNSIRSLSLDRADYPRPLRSTAGRWRPPNIAGPTPTLPPPSNRGSDPRSLLSTARPDLLRRSQRRHIFRFRSFALLLDAVAATMAVTEARRSSPVLRRDAAAAAAAQITATLTWWNVPYAADAVASSSKLCRQSRLIVARRSHAQSVRHLSDLLLGNRDTRAATSSHFTTSSSSTVQPVRSVMAFLVEV